MRVPWVATLVSFAIGALLGAAFLEIIPAALKKGDPHAVALGMLGGILGFFVLEKLLIWRHCHTENCEAHDQHGAAHDHGRSNALIMLGDTVHNFLDGVLIAAAFLESSALGIVTALAIVAHETAQESGDFLIRLRSGYTRARALALNALSSAATVAGGVLGYFVLQLARDLRPALLGVVAASMIYIAVADLIPGLHREPALRYAGLQVFLMALGVGTIALAGEFLHH